MVFSFDSQVSSSTTSTKKVSFGPLPVGSPPPTVSAPASGTPPVLVDPAQALSSAGSTVNVVSPKLMPEGSAVGVASPPDSSSLPVPPVTSGPVDTQVNGFIGITQKSSDFFESGKIGGITQKQTEDGVDDASVLKPWCEEWLKTRTDIEALEILISQRAEPSAVELMLSHGSELRKQFVRAMSYFMPPSDTSAAAVLKGSVPLRLGDTTPHPLPGGSEQKSFCMAMSWLLELDELQTVLVVQLAATNKCREITGLTSLWSYSAIESLYIARDVYFAQRNCLLRVITELLLIISSPSSADGAVSQNFSGNPYQSVVKEALDDIEREERCNSLTFRVEHLLDQLETLSIAVAPQQSYSQLMVQLPWLREKDAVEFLASHREKWAGQRLVDMSQLVEALIFSCTSNQGRMLPLSIAKRVLSLLVATQSERCIHAAHLGVFRVLHARLTVLAVGVMQLWRFSSYTDGSVPATPGLTHFMAVSPAEDNYSGLEDFLLMLKGVSRNCDRSSGIPVILMAGGILLHLGSAFRPDVFTESHAMTGRQFIQDANNLGCISIAESLLETLHPSDDDKGIHDLAIINYNATSWISMSASHLFEVYSGILSDLLNVLLVSLYGGCNTAEVQLEPLDASGLGPLSISNVDALCSFAARVHLGNPRLCNAFWESVSKMEKAGPRRQQSIDCNVASSKCDCLMGQHPMGFLLNAVLDVAPTFVSPLFRLLSATVYDPRSANHAYSILCGSGGLGKKRMKNSGSVLVRLPLSDRGVSWEFVTYNPDNDVGTICLLRDWDSLLGTRGIILKGGESSIVGKYIGVIMGESRDPNMNSIVAQFEHPVCIWSAAVSALAHGSEEDRLSVLLVMNAIFKHLPSALNLLSSLLLRWAMIDAFMEHIRTDFERAEMIAISLGGLNLKDIGVMTRTEVINLLNPTSPPLTAVLGGVNGEEESCAMIITNDKVGEKVAPLHGQQQHVQSTTVQPEGTAELDVAAVLGDSNGSQERIHITDAYMHILKWLAARPLPLKDGHVFFHEQLVSLLLEIVIAGLLQSSPSSETKCRGSCSALDLLAVLCNSKCNPWPDAVKRGLEQNDALGGGLFDAPGGKSIVEALCRCVDTLSVAKDDDVYQQGDEIFHGNKQGGSGIISQQMSKIWRCKVRLSLLRLAGGILSIYWLGERYSHFHCLLTLQDVTDTGCVALEQLRVVLWESGRKLSPSAFRKLCSNLPCPGTRSSSQGLIGYQPLLSTPCSLCPPPCDLEGDEGEIRVAMELKCFLDSIQQEMHTMKGKPLSDRGLRNKEVFFTLTASSISLCEEQSGRGSSVVLLALRAFGIYLIGEEIRGEIGAASHGHSSSQIIEDIGRDSSLIHLIVSLAAGVGVESDMMRLGSFSNKKLPNLSRAANSAVMSESQHILLKMLQVFAWAPSAISMALAQTGFSYTELESSDFKHVTNATWLSLRVQGALTGNREDIESGLFAINLFIKLLKRGQAKNMTDAIGPEGCHLLASMLLTVLDGVGSTEAKTYEPRVPKEFVEATMELWATATSLQPPALASMLLSPFNTTTHSHAGGHHQQHKADILALVVSRIFRVGQSVQNDRITKGSGDGRFLSHKQPAQPLNGASPRLLLYALDFLQALWTIDGGCGSGALSEVRMKLGGRIDNNDKIGRNDATTQQDSKPKYECCTDLLRILQNDTGMVFESDDADEGSVKEYCLYLSIHSRTLNLLGFIMHTNPEDIAELIRQSDVCSSFTKWMTRYTTLSLNSVTVSRSIALATKCGIDLSLFRRLLPQLSRTPGDEYFYSVDALKWLGYGNTELEDVVRRVNRNWSLTDAQGEALAVWRYFIEVCIVSRTCPTFAVDGVNNPPSSFIQRVREPSTSSMFDGDMQSFKIMRAVAEKLKSEKRTEEPSVIVAFCTELSTIMTSMLHHQMKEVVYKAAIPSHTILQPRPSSHLEPNVCMDLLGTLSDAMDHLFVLAAPPNVSLSSCATLRLRLLTSATLLIRAILAEWGHGAQSSDAHDVPKLPCAISGTCLRIFRHACGVLTLLQVSGGWDWNGLQREGCGLTSSGGPEALKGGRKSLLSICVALIMELSEMWNIISSGKDGVFGEVARVKEIEAWRSVGHDVISILLRHYKEGAKQAAHSYEMWKGKGGETRHNFATSPSQILPPAPWSTDALTNVMIILDFFVSAASSHLFLGDLVSHSVLDELSCCPIIGALDTKSTSRGTMATARSGVKREYDNTFTSKSHNTGETSAAAMPPPSKTTAGSAASVSSGPTLLPPQRLRGYGYDGEPCAFWQCWRSALSLAAGILHNIKLATPIQYSRTVASLWKSALLQAIKFISRHRALINDGLTLGLHCQANDKSIRSAKFTVLILEEQLAISSFLAEVSVEMTSWRCSHPELCTSIIDCIRHLVRNIAVLLGDGGIGGDGATLDKHKSIEQQEVLASCFIPVSSAERQEAGLEKSQALWRALRYNTLGCGGIITPYLLGRINGDSRLARLIFATHLQRLMCQILVPALQFLRRATPDAHQFVEFSASEAANITVERGSIVQLRPECDVLSMPATNNETETVTTAIIRDYCSVGVESSYVASILANSVDVTYIGTPLPPIKIAAAIVPKWRVQAVRDEGAVQPLLAYTPPQRLHCPPSANLGLTGPAFSEDPSIGHIIMLCKFAVAYATEIRELPRDSDIVSLPERQLALCMTVGDTNEHIRDLALICEMGLWMLMDIRLHSHPQSETDVLLQHSLMDLFEVHLNKESMSLACIDATYVASVKQALSSHMARSSHSAIEEKNQL